MSRRSLALVAAALALAGCGEKADTSGTEVVDFDIDSRLVKRSMPVTAVVPDEAPEKGRSMLVFLHGRSSDNRGNPDPELFDTVRELGDRAPVIVFPDGDQDKYWHDRNNGRWASYVLDEVIPDAVKRFDVDRGKVAIGGISMGGFGALAIRAKRPFCAAGGHSPALWRQAGETAPGAFDDAADFARHDVIGSASSLNRQACVAGRWRRRSLRPRHRGPARSAGSERLETCGRRVPGRARAQLLARPLGRVHPVVRGAAGALLTWRDSPITPTVASCGGA